MAKLRLHIILAIACLGLLHSCSCSTRQEVKEDEVLSFSVTTCVKNPEGFVYEDTIVNYDGGEYRPFKTYIKPKAFFHIVLKI